MGRSAFIPGAHVRTGSFASATRRRRIGVGRGFVALVFTAGVAGAVGCSTADTESVGPAVTAAPSSAAGAAVAQNAARQVVDRYIAAWNSGDGTAFGDTYALDAVHITFDGVQVHGRPEITRVHTDLFRTFLRDSRIALDINVVRPLSDRTVVVHTTGGILEPGDPEVGPDRLSVNTFVVSKHSDHWLIDTVQVTRVVPAANPN